MESKPLLLPTAVRPVLVKRALQLIDGFLHEQHESNSDSSKSMLNHDKMTATVPDDVIEKLTTIKSCLDQERSNEMAKSSTGKRTKTSNSSCDNNSSSSSSSSHITSSQQISDGGSSKKKAKKDKTNGPVAVEDVPVNSEDKTKKSKVSTKVSTEDAQAVDLNSEGKKKKKKKESLN